MIRFTHQSFMLRGVLALLLFAVLAPRGVMARSADPRVQTLEAASEQFRLGAAMLAEEPIKAREHLRAAAAGFEQLAASGPATGALHYNLGNAYLLAGDLGRAILNYRRAERLTPHDENLQENLSIARTRVASRIEATAQSRLREALSFWHEAIPPRGRFGVFLAAWAIAWGLVLWRVLGGSSAPVGWWPAGAAAVVAVGSFASLAFEFRARAADQSAVITAEQTIGRKGPDAGAYEPSFTEPLHSGVELQIVERRPGWVLARLADGRETWIDAAAVEPVRAAASTAGN